MCPYQNKTKKQKTQKPKVQKKKMGANPIYKIYCLRKIQNKIIMSVIWIAFFNSNKLLLIFIGYSIFENFVISNYEQIMLKYKNYITKIK